jgi:hypothetical protein
MKHEYHEGPKAGENFERLARAVLRDPKVTVPKKQPKAKPTAADDVAPSSAISSVPRATP